MDYAVILAGGSGERIWPLSTEQRPKELLELFGDKPLLRMAFERITGIFAPDRIYIVASKKHADLIRNLIPELPHRNIIAEPCPRNTAGAIALAAAFISARDARATMTVVTSDHIITPQSKFTQALQTALSTLSQNPDTLITFGVPPAFPSTQYGYLETGESVGEAWKVLSFKEKPDSETAEKYLARGWLWNAGMFVWRCETILREITTRLPEAKEPLEIIGFAVASKEQEKIIEEYFPRLPEISIDRAVLEKSKAVLAVPLACQWLDIGSYEALANILPKDDRGNSISGRCLTIDSSNNIIVGSDNHTISCIGLKNMIVVHTPETTLICPRKEADKIPTLIHRSPR